MTDPAVLRACLTTDWRRAAYVRFRDGIEIARLRDVPPDVALLRYAPGACVPEHRHEGLEMICVLDGAQSDGRGTCATGDVVLNPAGSVHSVWSEPGCVVLILWEKPITFLG